MHPESPRPRLGRARRNPNRLRAFLDPEGLESRQLLATAPAAIVALPSLDVVATPSVTSSTPPASASTPAQIRGAYGFSALGKTSTGQPIDGTGQTIAIVDAYNDPTLKQDLSTFDKAFGISDPPSLSIISQTGSTTALPATDPGWALEISLDVEWAHAIAPKANIVVVEANSASLSDLVAGVKYASTTAHANVVSISWGASEFAGETAYDSTFNVPGVTFVAASGDDSGIFGPDWPAASPNVVSVGGTNLSVSSTGTYQHESAWSGWFSGSTGGVSSYEPLPSYQSQAFPNLASGRVTPDVSYNASVRNGFAVYSSTTYQGQSGWFQVGGTSAGAPQWAALFALANQSRIAAGQAALSSASALSALYGAAFTEYQSSPSTVFHDITSGFNFWYDAYQGYDAVTGLGSPIANNLIQYLTTGKIPTAKASFVLATPGGSTSSSTSSTSSGSTTSSSPSQGPALVTTSVPVVVTIAVSDLNGAQPSVVVAPLSTSSHATPDQPRPSSIINISPTAASSTPLQSVTVLQPLAPSRLLTIRTEVSPPLPSLDLEYDKERNSPAEPGQMAPASDPDDPDGCLPLELYGLWDSALGAYQRDGNVPRVPSDQFTERPTLAAEPSSSLESTIAAGAAVALWGAWEYRSRWGERRQWRRFLGR
jgi:subtilase family serine protease